MTPDALVLFSGEVVSQQSVQVTDDYASDHAIGFLWTKQRPDEVTITPGVYSFGTYLENNITQVEFDLGTRAVACPIEETEFNTSICKVSFDDFKSIASAPRVTLKMTAFGKDSETQFGTEVANSFVNKRFDEFFRLIDEVRAGE
jgi:hypothetical protein